MSLGTGMRPIRWSALSILCTVTCLNAIGTYLFYSGFLLTRKELSQRNTCALMREHGWEGNGTDEYCWVKQRAQKVVLVVIDAFRFDFLVGEPEHTRETLFKGRMPKTRRLVEESEDSILFKFLADAPTTTMQRLKALTTGGLPTFIDFSQSFGAPAIQEDNILYQLLSNNKRTWFVGDDTWEDLFPSTMAKSMPYPSLNVKDLHTVDDGVEEFFPDAIEDINEWDVLIGHFLGVDHVGHIFSVDDEEMSHKLHQMDNFLDRTISQLEEKVKKTESHNSGVLFLLIGDHAQTLRGEHGGASKEEVETVMFAYQVGGTKSSQFKYRNLSTEESCQEQGDKLLERCIPELQQIDFAATLSFILDIPIPYGNVGSVSPLLFALLSNGTGQLSDILTRNADQVHRGLKSYHSHSPFSYNHASKIENAYKTIRDKEGDEKMKSMGDYFKTAVSVARAEWSEFNEYKMVCGLLVVLFSLFFHVILLSSALCKPMDRSTRNKQPLHKHQAIMILITVAKSLAPYSKRFLEIEAQATALFFAVFQFMVRAELLTNIRNPMLCLLAFLNIPLSMYNPLAFKGQIDRATLQVEIFSIVAKVFGCNVRLESIKVIFDLFAVVAIVVLWRLFVIPQVPWGWTDIFFLLPTTLLVCYRLESMNMLVFSFPGMDVLLPRLMYAIMIFHGAFSLAKMKQANLAYIFFTTAPVICLLHGRQSETALLYLYLEGVLMVGLLRHSVENGSTDLHFVFVVPLLWYLFFWHSYFATGHGCNFQSLNFVESYIGFEEFDFTTQGVLLAFSTFSIPFWCSFLLPVFMMSSIPDMKCTTDSPSFCVMSVTTCSALQTVSLLVASSSAGYQRRHLMAWGLFAPKFVFDSLLVLVSQIGMTLGVLQVQLLSKPSTDTIKKGR
eukprot:scaffold956_cov389-Pavlova_lutheri.AAC.8